MSKFQWDHPMSSPARQDRPKHVTVCKNAETACQGAHALLILTEWDEFKRIDFEAVYQVRFPPSDPLPSNDVGAPLGMCI